MAYYLGQLWVSYFITGDEMLLPWRPFPACDKASVKEQKQKQPRALHLSQMKMTMMMMMMMMLMKMKMMMKTISCLR